MKDEMLNTNSEKHNEIKRLKSKLECKAKRYEKAVNNYENLFGQDEYIKPQNNNYSYDELTSLLEKCVREKKRLSEKEKEGYRTLVERWAEDEDPFGFAE